MICILRSEKKPVPDLQDVSETRRRIRRCPGDDAVCILSEVAKFCLVKGTGAFSDL